MEDQLCQKFDMKKYLAQCEQLFVAASESYDILAVPSFENILALTFGVRIKGYYSIVIVLPCNILM